ncbi:MAG: PfkB family carbohydrate kinase, partial [Kiloniellaceae bacterium]
MSNRIVVFGSLNMDLVASVARIARPGETVPALGFASFPGGKGGNQALAAHLAGALNNVPIGNAARIDSYLHGPAAGLQNAVDTAIHRLTEL